MATTFTEEERNERVKQIGEYFSSTGKSTREISAYFTANFFPISNKTVSKYIHLYKDLFGNSEDIDKKIDINTSKSIEDPQTLERVLKVSRLVLQGNSINEIALDLNEKTNVIKGDIYTRLKMYSQNDEDMIIYYNAVKNNLERKKFKALEKNRKKFKK